MSPKNSLPVILVSACDRATAEEFITELIDNEVTETHEAEGQENGVGPESSGRVWRLVNKYYTADVLVTARGDADPPPDTAERYEAHVAYFTPQECSVETAAAACAERRACGRAVVRVAAMRAAREDALAAWVARARYEPVPLLPGGDGDEPPEARGVARVREALHAHPWPGLRRLDRAAQDIRYTESSESSRAGSEDECSSDEAAGVARAEQFAAALGALGAPPPGLSDAERRLRAEQLIEAFCGALGHSLDL